MMRHPGSGYEFIDEPEPVFSAVGPKPNEQVFWTVERQVAQTIDPKTGQPRVTYQYYVRMRPGSLIVAVQGDLRDGQALLIPQERVATTITRGRAENTYELPGGGLGQGETEKAILAEAEREFAEEAGYGAESFTLVGGRRSMMTHAGTTDHNYTVLARDAYPLAGGATQEYSEVIGGPEWFSWEDIKTMQEEGLPLTAEGGDRKIIDSTQTSSSLWLAAIHLEREARHHPTVIDLGGAATSAAGVIDVR